MAIGKDRVQNLGRAKVHLTLIWYSLTGAFLKTIKGRVFLGGLGSHSYLAPGLLYLITEDAEGKSCCVPMPTLSMALHPILQDTGA